MARSRLRGSCRLRLDPSAGRQEAILGPAENGVAALGRGTAVPGLQRLGWAGPQSGDPPVGKDGSVRGMGSGCSCPEMYEAHEEATTRGGEGTGQAYCRQHTQAQ